MAHRRVPAAGGQVRVATTIAALSLGVRSFGQAVEPVLCRWLDRPHDELGNSCLDR